MNKFFKTLLLNTALTLAGITAVNAQTSSTMGAKVDGNLTDPIRSEIRMAPSGNTRGYAFTDLTKITQNDPNALVLDSTTIVRTFGKDFKSTFFLKGEKSDPSTYAILTSHPDTLANGMVRDRAVMVQLDATGKPQKIVYESQKYTSNGVEQLNVNIAPSNQFRNDQKLATASINGRFTDFVLGYGELSSKTMPITSKQFLNDMMTGNVEGMIQNVNAHTSAENTQYSKSAQEHNVLAVFAKNIVSAGLANASKTPAAPPVQKSSASSIAIK
jgi:hypothetical protein